MKNRILFVAIASMFIFSFRSIDKNPEVKVLTEGEIVTNKRWIPNGRINFSIKKDRDGNIENISAGGSVFIFSEVGTISISDLNGNETNRLFVSKRIDNMVAIIFEKGFSKTGGYMNLFINLPEGLKRERFLISKKSNSFFEITNSGKLMKTFDVLYAVGYGITGYKIKY